MNLAAPNGPSHWCLIPTTSSPERRTFGQNLAEREEGFPSWLTHRIEKLPVRDYIANEGEPNDRVRESEKETALISDASHCTTSENPASTERIITVTSSSSTPDSRLPSTLLNVGFGSFLHVTESMASAFRNHPPPPYSHFQPKSFIFLSFPPID